MAVNIFLKIGDIKGESNDANHKDEIEVLSFSWGASNPSTLAAGGSGGAGAGKVEMSPFHFTAHTSKASPLLFSACCKGEHFKSATLSLRRSVGGKRQDYLVYRLSEVQVSTYQTGGQEGEELTLDEFDLVFAKIEVEFQPFDARGAPGKAVKAGWDQKQNKAV
jgi:type VI secretion system secreted protein Hcp